LLRKENGGICSIDMSPPLSPPSLPPSPPPYPSPPSPLPPPPPPLLNAASDRLALLQWRSASKVLSALWWNVNAPLSEWFGVSIGMDGRVVKIHIEGKQLTSVSPVLGRLTAMHTLNLGHNQLTSLPPDIGQLAALQELMLYNNFLTNVPLELGALAALRFLNLGNNHLTSVPPELGVGPDGYCSSIPRHRMPMNSIDEGLKCG